MVGLSGAAGALLVAFSFYSMRVIGEISVDGDRNMLKISRLNFFGSRTSDYVAVDALVPWTDLNTDISDSFQELALAQYEDQVLKKPYLYSLSNCKIYDRNLFTQMIGVPLN